MKSPITLPTKKEKIIRHSHCQKKKKDFLFNYLSKKNGNVIAYIYIYKRSDNTIVKHSINFFAIRISLNSFEKRLQGPKIH